MKKRKNFRNLNVDGKDYLYCIGAASLIIYSSDTERQIINWSEFMSGRFDPNVTGSNVSGLVMPGMIADYLRGYNEQTIIANAYIREKIAEQKTVRVGS